MKGFSSKTLAIRLKELQKAGILEVQSHSCPDGYHWENGECEAN
ncbi:MAG: hypothetical protein WBZ36_19710 [Candidatus Nitrosopolaris sp.]